MMFSSNYLQLTVFLVILFSILTLVPCYDDEFKKHNTTPNCTLKNEKPAIIDTATGSLKIPTDALQSESAHCIWIIEVKPPEKSAASLSFYIKNLKLDDNDNFTITTSDNKTINAKLQFKSNSIFVTGISEKNVTISLELTGKNADRFFSIDYDFSGKIVKPISEINDQNALTLPLHTESDKNVNLEIELLLTDSVKWYQLVLGVYESTLNASSANVFFSNTKNPEGSFATPFGDLFALTNNITIQFKDFSLSKSTDERLVLHYTLYDKVCSQYIPKLNENETVQQVFPTSDKVDLFNCLIVVDAATGYHNQLNYSKFNFINNLDTLTVRSGNRLTSPISSVINKQNFNSMKNDLRNNIQGPSVHINYRCSSTVSDSVNPVVSSLIISVEKGGGIFTKPINEKITLLTSDTYILIGENDDEKKNAMFEANDNQKLNDGVIVIYESLNINDMKPLIKITKGQLIPKQIWSKNHIIRVELVNVTNLNFNLLFTDNKLNSVANAEHDLHVINGNQLSCDSIGTWLIPATSSSPGNIPVYQLHISYIILNSSHDCVRINQIGENRVNLTTICGNGNETITDQSLPVISLNATYMYEVIFERGSVNCNSNDTSVLIQISLVSNSLETFHHYFTLDMATPDLTIKPDTYPNNYALRDPLLTESCVCNNSGCGFVITNGGVNSSLIGHVKFVDLDLASGDKLLLKYGMDGPNNLTSQSSLPNDYLIEQQFIELISPLKSNYNVNDKLSGRGFEVIIGTYDCGETIPSGSKGSLTTAAEIKGTKCMWIIDGSEKGSSMILNFTIGYATPSKESKAKKGHLIIYDTPTLRDPYTLKINSSLLYNAASVNRTIIVYEAVDKAPLLGLNITWKLDECKFYCDNNTRCILPEWRCDNISQCKDGMDQANCNSSSCPTPNPSPSPSPSPSSRSGGVNGWVIALVIIPLSMIVGAIVARFGPVLLRRFRGGSYHEFSDLSDVN